MTESKKAFVTGKKSFIPNMNKQEIEQWIENAELITKNREIDSDDNVVEDRIYKKDDKLHLLTFYNDEVSEVFSMDTKRYLIGEYMPIQVEVEKRTVFVTKVVEVYDYIDIERKAGIFTETNIISKSEEDIHNYKRVI